MSCSTYLSACMIGLGLSALTHTAYGEGKTVEVIKPKEQTTNIKPAAIDTERFELGAYVGLLSVEDFSTNTVTGFSLSYHLNSRFLAKLNYGRSTIARATFEDVSEGNFLLEKDRDFEYQSLLGGYELAQGRSFLGQRRKFNSHIYLLAGPGRVSFAGQDNAAIVIGISYKTVMTDWLTVNLDFQDIIVDREFLANGKTTHNTEITLNISAMF